MSTEYQEIEVNGEIVEFPSDMSDEEIAAAIRQSSTPQFVSPYGPISPTAPLDALIGAGETALSLGSSALIAPFAGLRGLGALSRGEGIDAAVAEIERAMSGAYQPRGVAGQAGVEGVAKTFEPAERALDLAGEYAGRIRPGPGGPILDPTITSPETAALVKGGASVAPMLTGRGNPLTLNRKALTNQQRVAQEAQQAGYRFPTSDVNAVTPVKSLVESGIGGKPRIREQAAFKNQEVTNNLANKSLGLESGTEITLDLLSSIRKKAREGYKVLDNAGKVMADFVFRRDVSAAVREAKRVAKAFDEALNEGELKALIDKSDSIQKTGFWDGADVQPITRDLRETAKRMYKDGQPSIGQAYRNLANAIEEATERHLTRTQRPEVVENFRKSRQEIAKTYTLEDALDGDGFVSAAKLRRARAQGAPLDENLDLIARVNEQFPSATRVVKQKPIATGRLAGMYGSGGIGISLLGEPILGMPMAISAFGGPLARAGLLSRPGQAIFGNPYGRLAPPTQQGALIPGLLGAPLYGDLIQ